jgi:predicted pyridoxine 5'-phosphate oxidase superfamily flavin-nucleotide-binding protein
MKSAIFRNVSCALNWQIVCVSTYFYEEFSEAERDFIRNARFFFLATVDADGQPQCSYKGGDRGFVKNTGPSELASPTYEGNGLYRKQRSARVEL